MTEEEILKEITTEKGDGFVMFSTRKLAAFLAKHLPEIKNIL